MKRPFSPEMLEPTVPDDIAALCLYLDDGNLSNEDVTSRDRKKKIKRLETVNQALQQDLARSRRVGRKLELDIAQLHRHRQREIQHERRAERKIRVRDDSVAACEEKYSIFQQQLVQLETRLRVDLCSHEQNELKAVLRDLVDRVELSAEQAKIQQAKEDLAWSKLQENDLRDCNAQLEKEWREAGDLMVVEQQLLTQRVESLESQLQATQQHLRDERHAGTELKAYCNLLQQGIANTSGWLTALALGSMAQVTAQIRQATCMEAERAQWQRSNSEQQRKLEEIQVEQSKCQNKLLAENAQLQKQLQATQNAAKRLAHQQQTLKTEIETLRGQLKLKYG